MAKTKEQEEFDVRDDETEEYEIPDGVVANEGQALTLDDLDAAGFDSEQEEKDRAQLFPPTGDWIKEDSWSFNMINLDQDQQPGDKSTKGRTIFFFGGRPVPRERDGVEYCPYLTLRMSPDKRFKQDKPNEFDNAYKLFLKSKDVYLSIYQEEVEKPSQLVTMLQTDTYVIRTLNGDNGPFVFDIKEKRERG